MFAEDDYDDETLEGTTSSPLSASGRLQKPTRQPVPDFGRRLNARTDSAPEMTKPPRLLDTIFQRIPDLQTSTLTSQIHPDSPRITRAPEADADPETTTVPITTATTEAPDLDAVVCSGRPFDSFMQIKNGSIYAFRGG